MIFTFMNSGVKSNEREFQSQVFTWLNELIQAGGTSFDMVSGEAGIPVTTEKRKTTRFPDIQLWINRAAEQAFCWWELKTPDTSVDDPQLLEDALQKARAKNHKYFVTWNMRETILWDVPKNNEKISHQHRKKNYAPLSLIRNANDLIDSSKTEILKKRAKEILFALSLLYKEGHFYQMDTDATFFVHKLSESVRNIYPSVYKALQNRVGKDAQFRDELNTWTKKQGIANFGDEPFFESVARQMVYQVIGKILFYVTLRRYYNILPKMDFSGNSPDKIPGELKNYFSKARQVDYQSIFEEDIMDQIEYSQESAEILTQLVEDLNRYNFSSMPQDIVGEVFEKLIPPGERHRLGQYFTPENLVDFINAFCVRTNHTCVLDPTCGLIRAYDKKRTEGERDHHNLLSQLWGFDIAQFPSELAIINLYRQNLMTCANFPRVLRKDFFEVKPGQTFGFPPPKPDLNNPDLKINEKLPEFDAIVGNFPYIRQELIEKAVKGYKKQLDRVLAQDWLKNYPLGFDKNQSPKLSGQADIFAYLFFHSGVFLKEGSGRMGIVTSNSWLDVSYGYELQKFFLNNFKIVAILESRCEPWFEDAAINTVVTVLEKCSSADERKNHLVKFVKIKKKLSELIPWDMKLDYHRRWQELDHLVHTIEHAADKYSSPLSSSPSLISSPSMGEDEGGGDKSEGDEDTSLKTFENDNFRIRTKKQEALLGEIAQAGKTVKWGQYLRAPDVYFEILEKCKDKLIPLKEVADLRYWIKTGINEFFYIDDEKIKHWKIEKEFLAPILKSYREIDSLAVDSKRLNPKLFMCNLPKSELRRQNCKVATKIDPPIKYLFCTTF